MQWEDHLPTAKIAKVLSLFDGHLRGWSPDNLICFQSIAGYSLPSGGGTISSLGEEESRHLLAKLKSELKGIVRMSERLHGKKGFAKAEKQWRDPGKGSMWMWSDIDTEEIKDSPTHEETCGRWGVGTWVLTESVQGESHCQLPDYWHQMCFQKVHTCWMIKYSSVEIILFLLHNSPIKPYSSSGIHHEGP